MLILMRINVLLLLKGTVRYETPPGEQAQLDWKESIPFETKDGEMLK